MIPDLQPYRALACSVIWQAVIDGDSAWFESRCSGPISFEWWCELANMSPDNIRRVLHEYPEALAWQISQGLSIWMEVDDEQIG